MNFKNNLKLSKIKKQRLMILQKTGQILSAGAKMKKQQSFMIFLNRLQKILQSMLCGLNLSRQCL